MNKENRESHPNINERLTIITASLTKLSLDKLNKVMGSGGGVGTGGTGSYSIAQKPN